MTAFGHVCGSICEVKQGPALSVKTKKLLHPHHICVSTVPTVTGIRRVAVAILVTVLVYELSYLVGVPKVSTVTGMRRVAVAILVTVLVFELSYLVGVSKVSTITRMSVPAPEIDEPQD